MANWTKEIMKLANDFCICTEQARRIVDETDRMSVPKGKEETFINMTRHTQN